MAKEEDLAGLDFEFTDGQVADMKEHFEHFDFDQDGKISKDDLGELMKALGQAGDADTLSTMMGEILGGASESEGISFRDYAAHMGKKWNAPPRASLDDAGGADPGGHFKRVFDIIDRDKDGQINQADVDTFVRLWGDEWSSVHDVSLALVLARWSSSGANNGGMARFGSSPSSLVPPPSARADTRRVFSRHRPD